MARKLPGMPSKKDIMTLEYEEDLKNYEWYGASFDDDDYVVIYSIETIVSEKK